MASFGEELKRERELRDISLKEISEATKISIRFLEALELNNFDILPGGIFNRGFIRAYARFIGVDGEEMVNAYLHEVSLHEARQAQSSRGGGRATAPVVEPAAAKVEPRAAERSGKHRFGLTNGRIQIPLETRLSSQTQPEAPRARASMGLWVLVALALLIAASVLTLRFTGGGRAEVPDEGHADALKARLGRKAPATSTGATAGAGEQDASIASADQPAVTALDPNTTAAGAPAEQPPASGPAAGTGSIAAGPRQEPPTTSLEPAPPPIPQHQVKVRAIEITRVTLECAGKITLDEELWPGQSRLVTCQEPVVLSASTGGALEYALDSGPSTMLGEVGRPVEGRVIAPIPQAAPAPAPLTTPTAAVQTPNAAR